MQIRILLTLPLYTSLYAIKINEGEYLSVYNILDVKNGLLIIIEENEIEESNNTSLSSNEVASKPTAKEVYDKAQSLFDMYTNYRDTYVSEIHDDLVLEGVKNLLLY